MRAAPAIALIALRDEDEAGICDTCPGELDHPEAVYQAEPGEPGYWRVLAVMGGAGLAALAIVHVVGRLGLLP